MLNRIIHFSIQNKLVIAIFVLTLVLYGSYQLTRLPIDAVPDITNNQVQVITVAPSYGASDIERLVTFPIEQVNSNIPGLIELRSFSRFGLSLVTIVFDDNVDIYWARQQVSERLQSVRSIIPQEIGTPELGPVSTGLGEIYQYTLRAEKGFEKKYDIVELRTIQDWIVRRQLLSVTGVAEVSSFGGGLKQYEIAIDPQKLQSYNVSIQNVFDAIQNNNENAGGSYIEKGPGVLNIRTEGLLKSPEDIGNICVKTTQNGTPLLISNIAKIVESSATRFGALCLNDEGEVAGAVVMMLKGANSSDVIAAVKKRIEGINKTLPEGVVIEPFLDRTKMVNHAISTVETNLMEGALIVVFVLVLFLGNFRAGILVASIIPLAMLFAVIMMNTFGVSGNLMSLGALDFGLIVDGAVIIVEAVMHRLSQYGKQHQTKLEQKQMDDVVEQSSGKMMNSAIFGQLIILVVYLPIFTLQGIEGKMFKPMAQTVAFALIGAFILSVTYVPMMSALFLSKKTMHKENVSDRLMRNITIVFRNWLEKIITYPRTVVLTVFALFVFALFLLFNIGGEFIPTLEEGDFAVETRLLTGSSLSTSIQETQKAAHVLKKDFPEVIKVVSKIGSGEVPTDPMPMEAADLIVVLKDKKDWTSANSFNDLAEQMLDSLSKVPGLNFSFQYPVQMRFNELMTGAKQDVVCKIFGEDLDTLEKYANKMAAIISGIEGAKDLYVEVATGMPQIIVDYNRSAMAQYNVSVAEINNVVNTAFAGKNAGTVFEGERRFSLVVRLENTKRLELADVQNLLIPTANGQVPLSHFAEISIQNGPNQIQREDAKRRIIIGFNTRGRDVQSIVDELRTKVDQQIHLPVGYYPTYGGAFQNLIAAKKRLSIAVPAALMLILLLLYFTFRSVKYSVLIFSAIPLSAIGGIIALTIRGMPFSISAGIGFIALFGVAVLNGIVLVSEFNRLKKEGIKDLREIILTGSTLRLRPVLMTAAVASLGFLPMALSQGAGAEVQRPLATVVIGGLICATFLTLFVLPIIYVFFENRHMKKVSLRGGAASIVLLILSQSATAQQSISLTAAIDTAFKNNLGLKNAELLANYREKLVKSGNAIPNTMITAEYGQINSSYTDYRIGVSQGLSFPGVYSRQKSVLRSATQEMVLSKNIKELELKREISSAYYDILLLQQKNDLLAKNDSLFTRFSQLVQKRFSSGETDVLEKIAAESNMALVIIQVAELKKDLEIRILEFNLLLNGQNTFIPEKGALKMPVLLSVDTGLDNNHPTILLLKQQNTTANLNVRAERIKLLPDLFFAYNNMSMKGLGADDVFYTGKSRFQSAQVGLSLPVFISSQRSKINAASYARQIAENGYQVGVQSLKSDRQKSIAEYNAAVKKLLYFEKSGFENSKIIAAAAEKQFLSGDINYLEYILLINQSANIENEYYESLRAYNEAVIQLNYLSIK